MQQLEQRQAVLHTSSKDITTQQQISISSRGYLSPVRSTLRRNKFKSQAKINTAHSLHTISSDETSQDMEDKEQKDEQQIDLLLAKPTDLHFIDRVKESRLKAGTWVKYEQAETKLVSDLKTMIKCDKYLRLVTSLLKTYRAFHSKNRVNKVYKEIVLARRVIRFQSKYDIVIDLLANKDTKAMLLFKLFQLAGDLTDLAAFWLKVRHQGTKKCYQLIESLEQLQSDFYFMECCIWLCVYAYRSLSATKRGEVSSQQEAKAQKQTAQNRLKAVKYLLDVLSSYNNSSLRSRVGEISGKLAGVFTFISSCIGIYIMWR